MERLLCGCSIPTHLLRIRLTITACVKILCASQCTFYFSLEIPTFQYLSLLKYSVYIGKYLHYTYGTYVAAATDFILFYSYFYSRFLQLFFFQQIFAVITVIIVKGMRFLLAIFIS